MVQSGAVARRSGREPAFAVLWDLDGVLVDTSQYHYAAWRRLMREHGRDLSWEEFQATFGMRNSEILPRLLPGISREEVERLSDRKESYFRDLLPERIPLLPGVERLVRELAAEGIPQAVASSTTRANLEAILSRLHLPLAVYVAAEDVADGKPSPEVFLRAAERLGVPPDRCIVVEDSVAGVEAARRAGMSSLAVATTWPADRLSGADAVVESLEGVSVQDLERIVMQKRRGARVQGRS